MFARDTTLEARSLQPRVLRGLSGPQKLRAMSDLSVMTHRLVRAGIRERLAQANESEREAEYFRVVLGEALAERVLEYRSRIRLRDSGSTSR